MHRIRQHPSGARSNRVSLLEGEKLITRGRSVFGSIHLTRDKIGDRFATGGDRELLTSLHLAQEFGEQNPTWARWIAR